MVLMGVLIIYISVDFLYCMYDIILNLNEMGGVGKFVMKLNVDC